MTRPWHPSYGIPVEGGPTVDDIERAQRAARQALEQDRTGVTNLRPIRHLRLVHPYDWEADEQ